MSKTGRVATAKLPDDVAALINVTAERIQRSKSWIRCEAVVQWRNEEQRRYALTMEAFKNVDEGRIIDHEDLKIWTQKTKGN